MIPYKHSRLNTKTGKIYEHIFTKEEKQEISERLKKGEKMADIMKNFRERFTEDDWIET